MSGDSSNHLHETTVHTLKSPDDTSESFILAKRYVLKHKLGRGGSASVYLANDTVDKKDVAVKLKLQKNPVSLRKEARITSEVQSKYIPEIFGYRSEQKVDYIIMQYIKGRTLKDVHGMAANQDADDLTFERKIAAITDIANALCIAHSKGYIHNDVKPTNILISGHLNYLIDWGIAIHSCEADCKNPEEHVRSFEDTTTDSIVKGTIMYMPPEQVTGNVTPKSDVYSLGAVAYELLTKNRFRNFTSTNQAMILAELVSRKGFVNFKKPDLPFALTDIIMSALDPDPKNRPTSQKFASDFAGYI